MHTTIISASMTAYSTAVGPSSLARKFLTRSMNLRIALILSKKPVSHKNTWVHWFDPYVLPARSPRASEPLAENSKLQVASGNTPLTTHVIRLAGGAADRIADAGEGLVGIGAEGGDGGDAHHDDQGQHDGVLNRGRAVFTRQEILDAFHNLPHALLLWCFEKNKHTNPGRTPRGSAAQQRRHSGAHEIRLGSRRVQCHV